jgi:hypothetical protein
MKKTLLFLSLFGVACTASAQTLISENFDSYIEGNVGADFTGATPNAVGVFTQSSNGTAPTTSNNAGNDNYQIITLDDVAHTNVLQITGVNGDKGSRQLWTDGFPDQWLFRDTGNDIIEVEYDLYTGTAGVSRNLMSLYVMDATRTIYPCGFVFNTNTLVLSGLAYYTSASAPIGNYTFYLNTGGTNLVLAPNTWVRLGVSFNKTTGQVRWKGPGINGQVTGAAMGTDPDRVSVVSTSGTVAASGGNPAIPNTAAATTLYDNFIVRASATDTLLGVEQVSAQDNTFAVYPNPATSVINVANKNNSPITKIILTDLNGRIVKQDASNLSNVQLNIGDLSAGVYMMNITSAEGSTTQKIVKQ